MKRYPNNCGPIEYINNTPYQIVARYPITEVKDPTLIKDWLNVILFLNQIDKIFLSSVIK